MPTDPTPQPEAVLWTDAEHADLVGAVVDRVGAVDVLAVGGPRRSELHDLAEKLGLAAEDDFRQLLNEHPASYVLLATTVGVEGDDLEAARAQETDVLTLTPAAASFDDLPASRKGRAVGGRLVQLPMFRLCPAWLAAAEPEQVLGGVHSLSLCSLGKPVDAGLYARLYDLMDMVVHLMGLPDAVDAGLTGPLSEPPENLRGLTGSIHAHLRFARGVAATLHCSDEARVWFRQMVALAEQGELRMEDLTYRLTAADSDEREVLDEASLIDAADLIARQWKWLMNHQRGPAVADVRSVLACCHAALLSCRTAQAESPQTFLNMHT